MTSINESLENIWGNSPLNHDFGRVIYKATLRGVNYTIPKGSKLKCRKTIGIVGLAFEKLGLTFALFIPLLGEAISRALSIAQREVSEKVDQIAKNTRHTITLKNIDRMWLSNKEEEMVYSALEDISDKAYVVVPIQGYRGNGMGVLYIYKENEGMIKEKFFNRTYQHPQLPWESEAESRSIKGEEEITAFKNHLKATGFVRFHIKFSTES